MVLSYVLCLHCSLSYIGHRATRSISASKALLRLPYCQVTELSVFTFWHLQVTLVVLFFPFNTMYRSSRAFFLGCFRRLALAPLYKVDTRPIISKTFTSCWLVLPWKLFVIDYLNWIRLREFSLYDFIKHVVFAILERKLYNFLWVILRGCHLTAYVDECCRSYLQISSSATNSLARYWYSEILSS